MENQRWLIAATVTTAVALIFRFAQSVEHNSTVLIVWFVVCASVLLHLFAFFCSIQALRHFQGRALLLPLPVALVALNAIFLWWWFSLFS